MAEVPAPAADLSREPGGARHREAPRPISLLNIIPTKIT